MAKLSMNLPGITMDVELDIEHFVGKLNNDEARALVDAILYAHGLQAFNNAAESVIGEFAEDENE